MNFANLPGGSTKTQTGPTKKPNRMHVVVLWVDFIILSDRLGTKNNTLVELNNSAGSRAGTCCIQYGGRRTQKKV